MDVDEILEQVNILDYIQQFCELEEKNGEWWGLSPLKEENTPSFSVSEDKQRFYDFSSGTGGNVIDFIKSYFNCSFVKALDILKKYAHISEDTNSPTVKRLECTKVAKRFRNKVKEQKQSSSKILSADYMKQYEFDLDKLKSWIDEGISIEMLKKYEVMYDSFSNRVVYPIKDYEGNIINVSGRTLDEDYKEKKLRKYTYFKPLGVLDTLYGFSDNIESILDKREIILFEGAKSVMIADGWGCKNACAVLTSHLNPLQMAFLMRLGVTVVFALDKEIDIREDINITKLKQFVNIEYVRDTGNLTKEKMAPVDMGKEVWEQLYSKKKVLR